MPYQKPPHIETILKNLPAKPGVYLLKNGAGKVIYVGKAKRLRNRVRSYFTSQADGNSKTLRMRGLVEDIAFIITENEVKALILEETLIQETQAALQHRAQRRQALSLYPRWLGRCLPQSRDDAPRR